MLQAVARTCRGSGSPTSTSSTNSFSASGCFQAWKRTAAVSTRHGDTARA